MLCSRYSITASPGSIPNITTSSTVASITVTWVAPLDDVWYNVLYTYNATVTTANTTDAMFELTGLDPGTYAEFTITAFNDCGAVAQTSVVQSTTSIRECARMVLCLLYPNDDISPQLLC